MNNKGQITIFIIIGLIILIAIGAYLYYKSFAIGEPEIITQETEPVRNFVEQCIEDAAKEGISILGFNGGYIYFPEEIDKNPKSYLMASPIINLKNPYWWYDGITAIPTEDFIKGQIASYVKNELKDCIGGFEGFNEEFNVRELGEITTFAQLDENDVAVKVKYPLLVKNKLNNTQVKLKSDYNVKIPVRLKQTYELAKKIMETENLEWFLEEKTIDLMAMDDEIPITGVEVTCDKKVCEVPKVRGKLKRLLEVNLPYIRIKNTGYDENVYIPNPFSETDKFNESYYFYHYVWDVGALEDKNIHASFSYDQNWPMDFYARPNDGLLLKSNAQKGQEMLSWFCLHMWHFTYDVNYPVKVTISDDKTEEHESYAFSFAFKVNLDHNKPARYNSAATMFEGAEKLSDEEFCNDVSKELTVYTISQSSKALQDISDVNLTFVCGAYQCDIGKSKWLSFGAAAGLQQKMPYCVLGILKGKKEGFADSQMFVQTDKDRSYTLYMTPVKDILSYTVVKHSSLNPAAGLNLESDEKAVIMIKTSLGNTFGLYPDKTNSPIRLLAEEDAEYPLDIYLISGENMIGGYKGTWIVNSEELRNAKQIKFHVIEQEPLPADEMKRYEFIAELEKHSKQIPGPELIK